MLAADASRERSRTINKQLKDCVTENIEQVFAALVKHAKNELASSASYSGPNGGTSFADEQQIQVNQTVDVRYQGQSHALNLPWHGLQNIEQAFHQKHKNSYGHHLDIDVELVNVRVRIVERRQSFALPEWHSTEVASNRFTTMPGIKEPVAVINRAGLKVGQKINGPALITETSSTSWLAQGWRAEVDSVGNLLFSFA